MSETEELTATLELVRDYEFRVRYDAGDVELLMDEPEPLGGGRGPNASAVLASAVGNCLSASLLFCLRKSHIRPEGLRTRATARMERNDEGRLRVPEVEVEIRLDLPREERARVGRCLEIFEDYCVVTQSVRKGLDVRVAVTDPDGHGLGPVASAAS